MALTLVEHAERVAEATGLTISVELNWECYRDGVRQHDMWSVIVGRTSTVLPFMEAWMYLVGIETGVEEASRAHAPA